MAEACLIIAESGSGKSTSIRTLDPETTFIINVANKPLPFKGWREKYILVSKDYPRGNMSNTSTPGGVIKALEYVSTSRPEIKTIVIDDWQYMSSFEFFDRALEKGYEKFTQIGAGIAAVAKTPKDLRQDLVIFFLTHAEDFYDSTGARKTKAKTIGKMIDEKLTLEGLFSIVLYGKVKKDKDNNLRYVFETKNSGDNTCKAPLEMFESDEITNDLELVRKSIINF
jgi:hypothetical protein